MRRLRYCWFLLVLIYACEPEGTRRGKPHSLSPMPDIPSIGDAPGDRRDPTVGTGGSSATGGRDSGDGDGDGDATGAGGAASSGGSTAATGGSSMGGMGGGTPFGGMGGLGGGRL